MPDSPPEMAGQQNATLTTLDRIIALQRVPMFAGLDPEDLEQIAGVSEESHFDPGEQIYRAGDDGTEMMVIIDGESIVTADHDGVVREVARYGPGQHVGEMAILHEAVRSAHVHAGDDGVFALVIADVDLRSVLEERPNVAIAMLGTLANRLAEQT